MSFSISEDKTLRWPTY